MGKSDSSVAPMVCGGNVLAVIRRVRYFSFRRNMLPWLRSSYPFSALSAAQLVVARCNISGEYHPGLRE